jgi:uncharacterized protein (DUF4415 family)
MTKKDKNKKVLVSYRIDEDIINKFRGCAGLLNDNMSELVSDWIVEYINNYKDDVINYLNK